MQTLSEKFNTIAVRKGDFFMLELPANASTGYLWDISVTQGQAAPVRRDAVGVELTTPGGDFIVGGGHTERTVWQAQSDGVIELTAELKRPWEVGKPAAKTHTFTIKVG